MEKDLIETKLKEAKKERYSENADMSKVYRLMSEVENLYKEAKKIFLKHTKENAQLKRK